MVRIIRSFYSTSCESCERQRPGLAQSPVPRARCRTRPDGHRQLGPLARGLPDGEDLRERRAVERDERPCLDLGRVAVLGVQTSWILCYGLHGLRRKGRVEVVGRSVSRIPLLARDGERLGLPVVKTGVAPPATRVGGARPVGALTHQVGRGLSRFALSGDEGDQSPETVGAPREWPRPWFRPPPGGGGDACRLPLFAVPAHVRGRHPRARRGVAGLLLKPREGSGPESRTGPQNSPNADSPRWQVVQAMQP